MLKNRRVKKLLFFAVLLVVLVGCKSNLDPKTGELIAERVIDANTKWSFSQGWFDFLLVMPFAKLILFFQDKIGVVYSIILVTILVNLLVLPLMVKSTVMSQKMQLLGPQQERIQNKYRGRTDQASRARMSAEMNALYQKNGIKMGQTLILPFLSMPILIGMWQAIQRIPSVYEATFLGLNLGAHPLDMIKQGQFGYIILLIVLGIAQYLMMEVPTWLNKRMKNYRPAPGGNSMKYMNIYMLVLIVFMSLNMPTAMSIYWIITSVIGIARSIYIHYAYIAKEK